MTAVLETCEPPSLPGQYLQDRELKQAIADARKLRGDLLGSARQLAGTIATATAVLSKLEANWSRHVKEQTDAFRKWTQEVGGDRQQLHAKHAQLERQQKPLQLQLKALEAKAAQLDGLLKARRTLLDRLG